MKKVLKAAAVFLLVLLMLAGGFWFSCRVLNHRSFMAGVVDLVLTVTHRSDKFSDLTVCEEFLAEKAVSNREPVELPEPKFGVSVREESEGALQAFIYNDSDDPAVTVFYFHGGAYVNQPNDQQFTMAARTAAETGARVVLMVYPKAPVWTCGESCDACLSYLHSFRERNACGKTVFMGDSAGGGLALCLAQQLRDSGEEGPEELILISPWVDASMENPDMEQYVRRDPMLGIPGLRRIAEVWAGDLDLKDPKVSPLYGGLKDLPPVTLFTGTWEILYPDALRLASTLEAAGNDYELVTGERMIHCYPIIPAPEAKEAQEIIWKAVAR